jgi:hypothetical protein
MQRILRLSLIGAVIVIVLVGLSYMWGASGRRAAQTALEETRLQLDVSDARSQILDARVSLYNMNFGDASRRLEDAKVPMRRLRERYVDGGRTDASRSLTTAIEHLEEAQRLAGKLDQAANSKAGEALEALRVATSK